MKAFLAACRHLARHRELYVLPLVVGLFALASIYAVNWLTGRPVVDDPGVIVGYAFNCIGCSVVLALTGFTQQLFFGFRGDHKPDGQANPLFRDDLFDAFVTLSLLALYSSLVFSLWR